MSKWVRLSITDHGTGEFSYELRINSSLCQHGVVNEPGINALRNCYVAQYGLKELVLPSGSLFVGRREYESQN